MAATNTFYEQIEKIVTEFPRKYKEGFLRDEILQLVGIVRYQILGEVSSHNKKKRPRFDFEKFEDSLNGITGIASTDGFLTYDTDLIKGLHVGCTGKKLSAYEWD